MNQKSGMKQREKNHGVTSILDLFELDELQRMQDLFSDATGVASIITRPNGEPLTRPSNFCSLCIDIIRPTEIGMMRCMHSDAVIGSPCTEGPRVHQCLSGGLWDAGSSIVVGGVHMANWLIGQVRPPDLDIQKLSDYAEEIGSDREKFMHALEKVPVMEEEQFTRIAKMLHAFAVELSEKAYRNLLLERMILDRKKAEEQISMLALALKSISECVCISDLDDNILFVNESFLRTYGYSFDELVGKPVSMVRSESNDPGVINQIMPGTMEGGWRGELMNLRKDGTEFPVAISTSLILDDSGEPVALMGIASDITESKYIQEALRESESKYKALFDGARDAIFIMNNACFLDCNQATRKIFGVTADQIIGSSPSDFSPEFQSDGELSAQKAQRFIQAALDGEPQLFDWVHRRFDGTPFHAEVGLNRIMLKGNWYLQAIVRDMTRRKQAEESIREKAVELERTNRLMIGRELKMIELKMEVNDLLENLGQPGKYMIHE